MTNEIKKEERGSERVYAKKSLGQNFLQSTKALGEIITASELSKKDLVIEIGPGEGILTAQILLTSAKLIIVEKDDRLIPVLSNKFEKEILEEKLKIIHGDILNLNITDLAGEKSYKLIANIPYYITGQIFRMFLETKNQPEKIVLLVQKEVAERIVTRDSKESVLSLSVKLFGNPKIIATVPRGAFRPAPNVDSAILAISDIKKVSEKNLKKLSGNHDKFFEIIKKAFNQKRKQIGGTLGITDEILKSININLSVKSRPEEIGIDDWISICRKIGEQN